MPPLTWFLFSPSSTLYSGRLHRHSACKYLSWLVVLWSSVPVALWSYPELRCRPEKAGESSGVSSSQMLQFLSGCPSPGLGVQFWPPQPPTWMKHLLWKYIVVVIPSPTWGKWWELSPLGFCLFPDLSSHTHASYGKYHWSCSKE